MICAPVIEKEQDLMVEAAEECDLCEGVGWIYEDATPLIIERLDEIIKILKQNGGN